MPKFIIKGMENSYIEEQKASINQLMMNLEQFPVGKTGSEGKNTLYKMKKFIFFLFITYFVNFTNYNKYYLVYVILLPICNKASNRFC